LGYERLDNPVVEALVNDLYRNEWSTLTNFFIPQMRAKFEATNPFEVRKRLHEGAPLPEHSVGTGRPAFVTTVV